MKEFVCPVAGCQKTLSKLQVMHFRSVHDCEPIEWVDEQYGSEIRSEYESGSGSYVIASNYEWLSPDMVCDIVETRTHDKAVRGNNNPMKRDEVAAKFRGENNPAKQQQVREKISEALRGHTLSDETKQKISRQNTGNEIGPEHRKKISKAASNRSTSYMQTEKYKNALSESLQGREPTYPTPYDVEALSHSVRSSWEEEIATLLVENGVSYVYEKEFELSAGSYYADFVSGQVVVEVKGFANDRSVNKATSFIEEYPDYMYVVVGDKIPCDVHIPWENRARVLEVVNDG